MNEIDLHHCPRAHALEKDIGAPVDFKGLKLGPELNSLPSLRLRQPGVDRGLREEPSGALGVASSSRAFAVINELHRPFPSAHSTPTLDAGG